MAPVLAPVLSNHTYRAQNGGQNWSQNWVSNLGPKLQPISQTFSDIFRACSKSLRYGVARVLQLSHFFARVLACVLRRLTTSSYLGGSLNGSHILRAFQVLKFGPPFSCNMLRARRRHAIDGEETQGPCSRRSKDENGAKSERQGTEARKTEFTQTSQHQICTYMSRHEEYRFHCHFRSMT